MSFLDKDKIAEILSLRIAGKTYAAIAESIGCSESQAKYYSSRAGLCERRDSFEIGIRYPAHQTKEQFCLACGEAFPAEYTAGGRRIHFLCGRCKLTDYDRARRDMEAETLPTIESSVAEIERFSARYRLFILAALFPNSALHGNHLMGASPTSPRQPDHETNLVFCTRSMLWRDVSSDQRGDGLVSFYSHFSGCDLAHSAKVVCEEALKLHRYFLKAIAPDGADFGAAL